MNSEKKILFIASVASMIYEFNLNNIKTLQSLGCKVEVATNFIEAGSIPNTISKNFRYNLEIMGVVCHQVDFIRGHGNFKSFLKTFKQLRKLTSNNYFLIHCHTPIGGVMGRLVFRKQNCVIMYTAHGFQFFNKGPKKDWILYYPVEKLLSRHTDILITINNEDYHLSNKLYAKKNIKIPGVGIDWEIYQDYRINKANLKNQLCIPKNAVVLISIGELSKRKNHIAGIKALKILPDNFYYLICGVGAEELFLKNFVRINNLSNRVFFMGYVNDKNKYLQISDLSLFLSKREGLGLAGLEAMAAGVPLVASRLGGITDYMANGETGFLINNPDDEVEVAKNVLKWFQLNKKIKNNISKNCIEVSKQFDIKIINNIMKNIYGSVINDFK